MKIDEIIKNYGLIELSFQRYYKYCFIYEGDNISLCFGGDKDDIYRMELNKTMKLKDLLKKAPIDEYSTLEINNKEVEIDFSEATL